MSVAFVLYRLENPVKDGQVQPEPSKSGASTHAKRKGSGADQSTSKTRQNEPNKVNKVADKKSDREQKLVRQESGNKLRH